MLRWFAKPKTMEDPLFGKIIFRKAGFWVGDLKFASNEETVQILITAGEEGPSQKQRNFYESLEKKYSELEPELGDIIHDTYSNWKEDFPRNKIWEVFELVSIEISNFSNDQVYVELAYDCIDDEDHLFVVELEGMQPVGLHLDG